MRAAEDTDANSSSAPPSMWRAAPAAALVHERASELGEHLCHNAACGPA